MFCTHQKNRCKNGCTFIVELKLANKRPPFLSAAFIVITDSLLYVCLSFNKLSNSDCIMKRVVRTDYVLLCWLHCMVKAQLYRVCKLLCKRISWTASNMYCLQESSPKTALLYERFILEWLVLRLHLVRIIIYLPQPTTCCFFFVCVQFQTCATLLDDS